MSCFEMAEYIKEIVQYKRKSMVKVSVDVV